MKTGEVSEGDRQSHGRARALSALPGMRSERRPGSAFHGEIESHELAGVTITTMHTAPVRVVRGPAELSATPLEAFYFGHQVDAPCVIEQPGDRGWSRPVTSG